MTKLSIITVTKNNHDGLIATYQSLCDQKGLEHCEWIIVDGASTDKTADALPELKRIIPNTTVISEPDDGLYDAMNKGLEQSTGQYMIWLNAGDQLADDTVLSTLLDTLNHEPDFIYGDSYTVQDDDSLTLRKAREPKRKWYGLFACHQTMVFKRDLIGDLHYATDYDISADYHFVLRYIKRVSQVVHYDSPMIIFQSGGISEQRPVKGRNENFRARKEALNYPLWANILIWILNTISWTVQKTIPNLYRKLR